MIVEANTEAAVDRLYQYGLNPVLFVKSEFGATPDDWQGDVLMAYPHHQRVAMKACVGPGKLESTENTIPTPNGPKRFGDLVPGSDVFSEDGRRTVVTAIHPQGVMPFARVTFTDGSSVLCGWDHLWKVRGRTERRYLKLQPKTARGQTNSQIQRQITNLTPDGWSVLTTKQILERGLHNYRSNGATDLQFEIPIQGAAQYPAKNLPVDPYTLGAWIGDGSRHKNQITGVDLEIDDHIRHRGHTVRRLSDRKSLSIYGLKSSLRSAGILDCYSYEKYIPADYKISSVEQRKQLLYGLMDTDGTIGRDNHCEFSTTSRRLAEDVVELVRSLGGMSWIKPGHPRKHYRDQNGDKVGCRECFRVTVTTPFPPFLLSRKVDRWQPPQERYLKRRIASIEPDGKGEAMCIEVAHPSRCYLTNDYIVTHNSACLAWIMLNFLTTRYRPKIAATSITGPNLHDNLWSECAKWIARSELLNEILQWTHTRIMLKEAPEECWISARTWDRSASEEQQGLTLSGLHADYIMAIADEVGGMPSAVVSAAEGVLSSAIEGHLIIAGNPTHLSGPLFEATEKHSRLWWVKRITGDPEDPERAKRVSIEWAREMIRTKGGRNSAFVRSKVLGLYPRQAFDALIGMDQFEDAWDNTHDIDGNKLMRSPKAIGVDVARYGSDRTVVCMRDGDFIDEFVEWEGRDTSYTADEVERIAIKYEAAQIVVDDVGVGGGVTDQLRKKQSNGQLAGIIVRGLNVAKKSFKVDHNGDPLYLNLKAELNMAMREQRFANRKISLPSRIKDTTTLVSEATDIRYKFGGNGKVFQIENKEAYAKRHNGESPDYWDALVLAMSARVPNLGNVGWAS